MKPMTRRAMHRLGIGLALVAATAVASRLFPGQLPNAARELARLETTKAELASASDAELQRWRERSAELKAGDIVALEQMLGPEWKRHNSPSPDRVTHLTREGIGPRDWPAILHVLRQLEASLGLSVLRIMITTTGSTRLLRVEITVRLGNAEPVAARGRLPVPRREASGNLTASREDAAPGQVRCSRSPRLSVFRGLVFI